MVRTASLCGVSLAALGAEPDLVQLDPLHVSAMASQYRQFDTVELTGSSILSPRSKQALPVLVYTRKDIERMGPQDLAGVVQVLSSQINGFHSGLIGSAIAESGPQAAAIHGLQNATLVLLNGRRLPGFSRATLGIDRNATDLNFVPLQAVDRIELLTDGASARYGSDAIAGVVNVVTVDQVKEGMVGITSGLATEGGGREQRAYVSLGGGDFGTQGFDWQLHGSLSTRQGLRTDERQATSAVPLVGDPADNRYYAANFYGLTRYGWPATTNNRLSTWGTVEPQAAMVNGQCSEAWVAVEYMGEQGCWYQRYHGLSVYPDQASANALASARLSLSPRWAAFAEGVFSNQRFTSAYGSATTQYWYQSLGGGRWAFASPIPLGPDRARYDYDQHSVTLGIKGTWQDWQTQLGYTHGAQQGERRIAGPSVRLLGAPYLQNKGLTEAELTTPLDQVSAETLAKLGAGLRLDWALADAGASETQSVDWIASKTIAQTDAGDISLGVGLAWRKERQRMENFDTTTLADRVPANPIYYPVLQAARETRAGFAELELPLTPMLTVNGHLRYDQYSDVGEVATGKLALRYKPNSHWLLRGSVGSGFRAPDLLQTTGQTSYIQSSTFNGVTTKHYYAGNPGLKPEESLQQTLGVRWDPSPQWTLGGDFWRVHLRNELFVPNQTFVARFPEWAKLVKVPQPDGSEIFYLKPFNLGESWREGLDYDLQFRKPTQWGRVRAVLRGTHYLKAQSRRTANEVKQNLLGEANGAHFDYVPTDKLSLQVALERATLATWLTVNYLSGNTEYYNVWNASVGGNLLESQTYEREVSSYWTMDIGARYQPSPKHLWEFKVTNLLNQYPPFRALAYPLQRPGVNASYGDYYGRTVQVRYEYSF